MLTGYLPVEQGIACYAGLACSPSSGSAIRRLAGVPSVVRRSRHIDHITRHSEGGATSYSNGRGVCERCNYAREMPGWQITVIDAGLLDTPHSIMITTPTGHHYLSRDPP